MPWCVSCDWKIRVSTICIRPLIRNVYVGLPENKVMNNHEIQDYPANIERGLYYQANEAFQYQGSSVLSPRRRNTDVPSLDHFEGVRWEDLDDEAIELLFTIWKIILFYIFLLIGCMLFISILTFVMVQTDAGRRADLNNKY